MSQAQLWAYENVISPSLINSTSFQILSQMGRETSIARIKLNSTLEGLLTRLHSVHIGESPFVAMYNQNIQQYLCRTLKKTVQFEKSDRWK